MMHNYPAYVFRMTSLLEKLEIVSARYIHQDDVRSFCDYYVNRLVLLGKLPPKEWRGKSIRRDSW